MLSYRKKKIMISRLTFNQGLLVFPKSQGIFSDGFIDGIGVEMKTELNLEKWLGMAANFVKLLSEVITSPKLTQSNNAEFSEKKDNDFTTNF